ncbi:CRISPR-associated endoribonuclease Cas6 [Staphylococcus debuckii]|uniref:CRISPR-associated endoribonuclease Cas6 n=1 Tax=Staphylococcus debuckii TaxID=2044912 RepID=UPI0013DF3C00|nr:CRISPR-associated endoribonuclease Cas6 [Staphylococcus debuckii]
MENLSDESAEFIHHLSYSPLKQRLIFENDETYWEIVCLEDGIAEEVLKFVSLQTSVYLKYHDLKIDLLNFNVERVDVKKLLDKTFSKEKLSRTIKLKIITPMSFKSSGQYDIFPDLRKLFRSIMLQYDAFFESYEMYDRETLSFLTDNIKIIDYQLWSTKFHLEGVRIPSFKGNLIIKINGPLPFLQLVHFLIEFGEYTGAGIKTSLGMGKFNVS